MIFSKVFIAVAALAVSGSVNASPCRPSSEASSSTLLSTSTVSASTETTASTSGESSTTATATATTTELSSTTAETSTTVETSSIETSTIIQVTSTTAETSATAEASSTTVQSSTTFQTSSTTAEASSSTTSVCVEPTNFVQNPSFENGDEPWFFSPLANRVTLGNGDGDYVLELDLQGPEGIQYAQQTIGGFTVGLQYKVSYQWYTTYVETPYGCAFYLDISGSQQDSPMGGPNDFFVDGPSFTFTATAQTLVVQLGAFCGGETYFSVNLDSVVILPVQPVCSRGD
ncbi:hypothetical protein Neosp_012753 [[Neocosmospora] mangrovei]